MNTQYFPKLKKIFLSASLMVLAACAGNPASGPVPEGHYRVQSGDNLYRIGLRFGQSVKTLAEWNNLHDTSKIEVGQVLRVRSRGVITASSPHRAASRTSESQQVAPVNRLNLQWPVENGVANIIEQYNGNSNKGIDIKGEPGTPVKAAASGKVLYAGEGLRGYGKLVLVSHNSSTLTAYAHNDSISVQKGQTVQQGQTIATMGSTDTDRVKLHFEVRINGKAVNPMLYLR
ncbi:MULTISPECIES: M23 family metallopeptidase [unclassified Neisseria]|uniref:M23 family metallopeptidase n=1 Tax=unclassified Neisseria TaxID=2623750 RepID=UPI0026651CDF|nr:MULTISPECIES: M23 family metallopeptidase [unclassified Neisseria]MDO1510527.1 M23 family metallopeptidase [Neisseria sp. MVDL19-042950]MDO1516320.1 M23 family metallopeptidase [Neisseria sp. MVDL18-041461]MDO1564134.1 M23 family metallopeptidase [Neisseria sp. MVDL20-010259]